MSVVNDLTQSGNPYERVIYHNRAYAHTHPSRLASLGILHGITVTPPSRSRVLEIGCGAGGNLLPMAELFPQSEFVGVDYSLRHIDLANGARKTCGISNAVFHCLDINDMQRTDAFCDFDYVIAHGVYSWVDAQTKDALLQVIAKALRSTGVGFVSCNVYPGFYQRKLVSDLLRYHAEQHSLCDIEAVKTSRECLRWVSNAQHSLERGYSLTLREELWRVEEGPDWYVFHDHFGPHTDAVYLHDFVKRLAVHGLEFVGDADFVSEFPHEFDASVVTQWQALSRDRIERAQYLDFLRNRVFRQNVVVRKNKTIQQEPLHWLQYHVPDGSPCCEVIAKCKAWDAPDSPLQRYQARYGPIVTIDRPLVLEILRCVTSQAKNAMSISALYDRVQTVVPSNKTTFASELLFCFSKGLLDVTCDLPGWTTTIAACPLTTQWSRFQARNDEVLTNVIHESWPLDPWTRFVLPMLDGKHPPSEIVDRAKASVQNKTLLLETQQGEDFSERNVEQMVNNVLAALAQREFLVESHP